MDPSAGESTSGSLVVFGPNQIDTSRAEILVQCLHNKIKEKRYKLQKLLSINEENKKRYELMKSEKNQLVNKVNQIEHENMIREQQLQTEQIRIKELQMNIQILAEHNNSLQRDFVNEGRKFEQQKLSLIEKFEKTKQSWTHVFKPQYEQSTVYQYLKQNDTVYQQLVERKESLLSGKKEIHRDYLKRRQQCWKDQNIDSSIVSMAKYFIARRDQLVKVKEMKRKCLELENYKKQLIESKIDKMRAWEHVYTQPVKRDLMDFCLQADIDQGINVSLTQIQSDVWSQPSTPTVAVRSNSFDEQNQTDKTSEENVSLDIQYKNQDQTIEDQKISNKVLSEPPNETTESTITIIHISPNKSVDSNIPQNRPKLSSVLHLTTAIEDDDDDIFPSTHRNSPDVQIEKMTIHDGIPSTQSFVTSINTNVSGSLHDGFTDYPSTQSFNSVTVQASNESDSTHAFVKPTLPTKSSELSSLSVATSISTNPSNENTTNKSHLNVTFQLTTPKFPNRSTVCGSSSIQPQVTSNDVQQMLLSFSTATINSQEDQAQPMEDDVDDQTSQQPAQNRSNFPMLSSIESNGSIEEEYASFNYNFGFQDATNRNTVENETPGFTSPINFSSWQNLSSPLGQNTNDQFPTFLQQSNESVSDGSNTFAFPNFGYADMTSNEISTDASFESFFFANNIKTNTANGKAN